MVLIVSIHVEVDTIEALVQVIVANIKLVEPFFILVEATRNKTNYYGLLDLDNLESYTKF